jgi:hypothetical protein
MGNHEVVLEVSNEKISPVENDKKASPPEKLALKESFII